MARRRSAASASRKATAEDKTEKKFKAAIESLEKLAHERCITAHDPFSCALKMAKEIRKLSEDIEKEAETAASTEAGHCGDDGGAVGIGVM
jgi:hypothetical protein